MIALFFLALVIGWVGWLWLRQQPLHQRKPAMIKLLIAAVVVAVAFLALTGRFYLVLGLLAGLLPFARRLLPGLLMGRLFRGMRTPGGGAKPSRGNRSRVATDILDMSLDHDSGDMDGRVLKGPLAGQALADMSEAEFLELLRYCRQNDVDSARLLESYLDRRFGDSWRNDDQDQTDHAEPGARGGGNPLTEQEALEILGLELGATREEIIQAHRQMMQKMHPDRGGSTYLAALINEAKTVLLR
ncbi:hypothetical protein LCGC14_0125520 [marine sediment metagenome]|uniref:J domain-containing protein n=1 Tax=marine sediment metagenome TaxID=412755 RepID=A0A0F9V5F6_9ZZZZ